ncbi:MAG: M23 family metallopeptidase [Ginsengibacter sp.]
MYHKEFFADRQKIFADFCIVTLIFAMLQSCNVSKDPIRNTARLLQKGRLTEDTSFVYSLPYEMKTCHRLIQAYFSNFSHKNRAALDFKMKRGTKIYAARGGVVLRLEKQYNNGGRRKKYRKDANYLVIQQNDGSKSGYWHLQHNGVLVNVGDTIKQGQLIALSGNTGYSFLPHLHFLVWTNKDGGFHQIPTRFATSKGTRYLRPLRRYCNP